MDNCDLREARYQVKEFTSRIICSANLGAVDWSKENLWGADLQGVALVGSILKGVNFTSANFENADLRNCKFQNSAMESTNLSSANLGGAQMQNINLRNSNLTSAVLEGANLTSADLRCAVYDVDTCLKYGFLKDAKVEAVDWTGKNLSKANMPGVD